MRVGESSPLLAEASGKIQVQLGARCKWGSGTFKGERGAPEKWGECEKETLPFNFTILPKAWLTLKIMLHT